MRELIRDRRFWLLICLSACVLLLGKIVVPAPLAIRWVSATGYWFIVVLVVVFGWAARARFKTLPKPIWGRWTNWRVWIAVLIVAGFWQAHEKHAFKILADEALLLGTSQTMHLDRAVGYPVRATDVRGPFEILQVVVDKRPVLFPFLVSLVHDLTGYRPSNPFWVNSALSVVFLVVIFGLGSRVAGTVAGGWVTLIWWAGIPLMAQQATGGGFELLNLTLLAAWVWLGMLYAASPDRPGQDLFVVCAVMLASTRYESLLYLAPTALLLIWVWIKNRAVIFSSVTWLAPVLLLPTFWLNRAFEANEQFWELKSRGADAAFGLNYFPGNVGHAVAHFLSLNGFQPNSVGFGAVAMVAAPFLVLWLVRKLREIPRLSGEEAGLLVAVLGLIGGTAVMMFYFWGQFDHAPIHRLSLPTQLLMSLAVLIVVGRFWGGGERLWRCVAVLGLLTLVIWSLPTMTRRAYAQIYIAGLAYEWRSEIVDQLPSRNVLAIDNDSTFWITRGISASPVRHAMKNVEGIAFHFRNHSFDEVLVVQRCRVDPETAEIRVDAEDDLGAAYKLETIRQHRLEVFSLIRISRVVGIEASTPAPEANRRNEPSGAFDRETYMREWIKHLP